ncbi:EsaB/YukD family protein [[Mycobacterium] holstebronense]|uniref:EsaB/YukD family protein n=1 Tax=[Mycobacterium] holstebronense TaxID=3064288 RepID=A0ABN9NLJ3_9MYCO|nr:EsaB/YukD family protein [Mycolicibacter sp. MU0102]CAJ1508505.1 EsaB/YukD family protein [Mycolicibacter sp. MU0102]
MSNPDSGLRRVAVHADNAHADLTLPSGVPVATLIRAVVELMPHRTSPDSLRPYRLSEPGRSALDGTKTLSQQGIRDGSTLVLTRAEVPAPQVSFDDPVEQVAAAVRTIERAWNPAARRLGAALTASGLAGVAGFVAIPGGPGAPNALLAVAATGAVALITVPPSGCNGPARTTLCCLAGLAVVVAVVGMAVAVTGIALPRVGAAAVVAAVGMIRVAGRVAAAATGLFRRGHAVPSQVGQTHDLLTGLVAAAAALAALGAAAVVGGAPVAEAPHLVGAVFAATAGMALALRARSHTDGVQIAALIAGGTATLAIGLLGAASNTTAQWPAALAVVLVAAALALGFTAPTTSPLIRRGADVMEGLALGSLVPLACWLCGFYSAARGLNLG